MFQIILYLIGGVVYLACPIGAKAIIFVGNMFIPDPLPYIDEIFMIFTLFVSAD